MGGAAGLIEPGDRSSVRRPTRRGTVRPGVRDAAVAAVPGAADHVRVGGLEVARALDQHALDDVVGEVGAVAAQVVEQGVLAPLLERVPGLAGRQLPSVRSEQLDRVPAGWRILYKDGDQWKPIETSDAYGVEKDKYNRVTFKPVTTTGLRLEVTLQPTWAAGIHEWKVK